MLWEWISKLGMCISDCDSALNCLWNMLCRQSVWCIANTQVNISALYFCAWTLMNNLWLLILMVGWVPIPVSPIGDVGTRSNLELW